MLKFLPALDLLAHNAVAVLVATVALFLLMQMGVVVVRQLSTRLLSLKAFASISEEERSAFSKGLQRRALKFSLAISLLFAVGVVIASYRGVRALDELKAALAWIRAQDFSALRTRLLTMCGVLVLGYVSNSLGRGIVGLAGKSLLQWERLEPHRDALPELILRLGTATRVVIASLTIKFVGTALEPPQSIAQPIGLIVYVVVAFHLSRLGSKLVHLVTDMLITMSGSLAKLQSPLKALSNLKNLAGVTKRAGDYLVYVGAATWVAGQVAADAWYYGAGQIGLRLIVIFYTSRVLVEACILLIQEVFLGKPEDHTEADLQRRRTLIPVMMGLMRYGIYFVALIMALKEASIDPTPLLAGAGVLGVAIGFGAQTFVGDIVAGFFILFEDLVLVGDLVEIGGIKGEVEEIGVRITRIRDEFGVLHSIPNGEVRKVSNHSREYVHAVVDVHVPYEEDPRRIRLLLAQWTEEFLGAEGMKRGPAGVDVEGLTEGSVLMRIMARVPPGKDKELGDALRGHILEQLRSANVGAPRPRRAVIVDTVMSIGAPEPFHIEEAAPVNAFKPSGGDS